MKRDDGKKIIVVSSQLDSISFIKDMSMGFAGRAAVVASMAVAASLRNVSV
jgi:hypothetical protein